MNEYILTVSEEYNNERADKFISENSDISRSFAQKLCNDGVVIRDGVPIWKKDKVHTGDVLNIAVPEPIELDAEPEDIPINIVFEDESVIVVNKEQGMVVHPAAGNASGTLVNALLFHSKGKLSAINGVVRPGIVHRIDKDTSGLLVVAKTNDAHLEIAAQLKERKALRRYIALVNGNIKEDSFTVNKPIARHPLDRKRMAIVQGGREAVTHVKVLERFGNYTLIECVLETGRTHQIRVHMASVNHSIVGDRVYGIRNEKIKTNGQLLHAKTLGFVHPVSGELMTFDSDLPEYFGKILDMLRTDYV